METNFPGVDFPELARASQEIWNQNARWWDARMKEGNDWHNRLIAPAVERLLDLHTGEDVVDLACGNGLLARALARQGARVLACDFSTEFLECARARSQEYGERIRYRLIRSHRPESTRHAWERAIRCRSLQHGHYGYGQHHTAAQRGISVIASQWSTCFLYFAPLLPHNWNQADCGARHQRWSSEICCSG